MAAIERADGFGEHYTPDDFADEVDAPPDLDLELCAVLEGGR